MSVVVAVAGTLVAVLLAWLLDVVSRWTWRRWKNRRREGWKIEDWRNWASTRGDERRMEATEVSDENEEAPLLDQ